MNQDCMEVMGSGRHIDISQLRAWRMDNPPWPSSICGYRGWWGGALQNGTWSQGYTSYHPECSFAYPAWLNGTIYADFMNETWFEGEWAENGYWSGCTLYVCIKLHVWDNCS